jgi:hypothetical protein
VNEAVESNVEVEEKSKERGTEPLGATDWDSATEREAAKPSEGVAVAVAGPVAKGVFDSGTVSAGVEGGDVEGRGESERVAWRLGVGFGVAVIVMTGVVSGGGLTVCVTTAVVGGSSFGVGT